MCVCVCVCVYVSVCEQQSMEHNATCRDQPTMVSKPYYRVDLFNRQMQDVLLTSLLVTIIENKTVAHIGTSTGRLLQVRPLIIWHTPYPTGTDSQYLDTWHYRAGVK